MSETSDDLTATAELDLLRQGLAARGGSEAIIEAIAQAAREASLSPVAYLVCEGSLSRDVAQTLQAVRKGYMRVPLTTLLAGLRLPATLKAVVDRLAKPPSPDSEPGPEPGTEPGPEPGPESEPEPEDMLGPLPEWNSIEDEQLQASAGSSHQGPKPPTSAPAVPPAPPVPQPEIDPIALSRALKPGERIETYTLRELVSASTTSIVYRAYDERERQSVQVKMLQTDVSRRERERFLNETRILSGLTHPNILRLISSGEHRQTPFIVYENVFSIGLDEHLVGAGQKDADFILKVAMTASRGLRAAADAGINHRDIKPSNLFLYAPDGRVKVTNFGLSSDPSIGPEGTSTLRGTPSYMAPELVVAAHSIDHRADMYSLGVTLYEAATGQLPFVKSTLLETMRAHVYDTPCALLDRRPSFPRGLAATIERLLSKRPDERFPDWAELVATFESIRCESENPISEAVTRAVKGVSGTASLASIYRKNNT